MRFLALVLVPWTTTGHFYWNPQEKHWHFDTGASYVYVIAGMFKICLTTNILYKNASTHLGSMTAHNLHDIICQHISSAATQIQIQIQINLLFLKNITFLSEEITHVAK
jgi:hypothetical protein